jgi:hypothetical protein
MRAIGLHGAVVAFAMTGCAGTIGGSARAVFAPADSPSVRISAAAVVNSRLSPLVPVHLTSDGAGVAVTFGHQGRTQATARLDPATLQVLSVQEGGPSEPRQEPAWGPARVGLDGGRFLVCWTETSPDGGRRVMARLWAADGHSLGAAVPISPADADVLGAPNAVSTDGRHALVTFAAASGTGFELRAVSLENALPSVQLTAAR